MAAFTVLLYVLGVIVSWIIFYYVVKAAVSNGIREARSDKDRKTIIVNNTPERPINLVQAKLQEQYNKGELTFEEFQMQWNAQST